MNLVEAKRMLCGKGWLRYKGLLRKKTHFDSLHKVMFSLAKKEKGFDELFKGGMVSCSWLAWFITTR